MSTDLVEIREKQPQKRAKLPARPAANKPKEGRWRIEKAGEMSRK
jgi:hypothetical protein